MPNASRGPFFLPERLPADDRDEALIDAIGASDIQQLDGVGGRAAKEIVGWKSAAPMSSRAPEQLGVPVKSELAKWEGVVQRAKLTTE